MSTLQTTTLAPLREDFHCWRVESTSFDLDGSHYDVGSWLIQGPSDRYAKAMTQKEYEAWSESWAKRP